MPYLKRRTNKDGRTVWMVQVFCGFDDQGKSIMKSATSNSPSKRAAQALAQELLAQHRRGELVLEKGITIGSLLDDLLLDYQVNKRKALDWVKLVVQGRLKSAFGSLRPEKLTTSLLQQYIAARQAEGLAAGTINLDLALLRRSLNLGAQCTPPKVSKARIPRFPMLRLDNVRKGFFEHEQYQALFRVLPEELQGPLAFAYYTGCRRAEILGLQWPQVDLDEKVVRLEPGTTKNREGRTIPLSPELVSLLTLQKQRHDLYWPNTPWVFFHYATGRPINRFPAAWRTACRKAGLWEGDEKTGKPTHLFHDLRRTGVRNLVRAGAPEVVVMRISGHKTRSVFDRYNIVSERDLKEAATKLSHYLETKQAETSKSDFKTEPVSQRTH